MTLINRNNTILQNISEFQLEITLYYMQTYEFFSNSNPRTRSFLSPSQKFGCRSLSTSESYPTLSKTTNSDLSSWKKYKNVPDKPIHPKQYKKQPSMKLQECNHKTQPQAIQKNSKNRPHFQSYYYRDPQKQHEPIFSNQSNDLHVLIRQMKEKIRLLEKQNLMLREQQVEDVSLTKKQNQVIYELENIIKELSNRQQSLRNVLNLLKTQKTAQNSELQCEECLHSVSYFGILKQNIPKQISQAVIKIKEERDFLRKQVKEHEKKRDILLEESYSKSRTIEELKSQRFFPDSYLQLCAKRNSEINAISELLNGI